MSLDRRNFLTTCTRLGFASTLLPGTLYTLAAEAEDKRITADMIDQAANIAGVPIAPDQTAAMLALLNTNRKAFDDLRDLHMANSVPPAKQADKEIASGKYRGILHGLPWGGKDLLAVKGYPTTWGAGGFEHQMIDEDATVVQRLDAAGAVLVAKLSLGSLALGDRWFGGQTRNPWNTQHASTGSSAGPAPPTPPGCAPSSIRS